MSKYILRENCTLNGNDLAKNVVYEAKINHDTESMIYCSLCGGEYKCGAVAERIRHRSREQRVPSSSPAWTSVLR